MKPECLIVAAVLLVVGYLAWKKFGKGRLADGGS
jgi:hypothetical protein